MVKKIILAAGGTGGHVFPAKSIINELKKNKYEIEFITDNRCKKYFSDKDLKQINLKILNIKQPKPGLKGKSFTIINVSLESLKLILSFLKDRPKYIISFGGYPTFPVLVAATCLKIPFILHEQNSVLGMVNKIFSRFAKILACGFKDLRVPYIFAKKCTLQLYTKDNFRFVGNPVREEFYEYRKEIDANFKKYFPPKFFSNLRPLKICVIGGSQGASILGANIADAIKDLNKETQNKISIIHQARDNDIKYIEDIYKNSNLVKFNVKSFFKCIAKHMKDADIIISRSGASTIAEITALAKPSIQVPFSKAKFNHQCYNAAFLKEQMAAILILEKDFTVLNLQNIIKDIIKNPDQLINLSENCRNIEVGSKSEILDFIL